MRKLAAQVPFSPGESAGQASDHWTAAYERGGISILVLEPLPLGTEKLCGVTFFGAAKLLEAFRSSPVSSHAAVTFPGA